MSTETVPEIDVDVTSDVLCEWSSGTCGKPATWMGITVCCRKQAPACNECRDELNRLARDPDLEGFRIVCSCGHITTPRDWHEWRPL